MSSTAVKARKENIIEVDNYARTPGRESGQDTLASYVLVILKRSLQNYKNI